MAFAMKRGGGLAINVFSKIFFFVCKKKHLELFPDCQNVSCTKFGLYIIYI